VTTARKSSLKQSSILSLLQVIGVAHNIIGRKSHVCVDIKSAQVAKIHRTASANKNEPEYIVCTFFHS